MRYTHHYRKDLHRPQMTFSLTFTTGFMCYSMCNDKGLVVTRHEATRQSTKVSVKNAAVIPESILLRQLVENCVSVEEVLEYLEANPPATSHIITLMDARCNGGILEILPPDKQFRIAYYRCLTDPDDQTSQYVDYQSTQLILKTYGSDEPITQARLSAKAVAKQKSYGPYLLATNHFINATHIGSGYSHDNSEGTETRDSSHARYDKMRNALDSQAPSKFVITAGASNDTVQAMRFCIDRTTKHMKLTVNWANNGAGVAADGYEKINLTGEFLFFDRAAKLKFFPKEVHAENKVEHKSVMSLGF